MSDSRIASSLTGVCGLAIAWTAMAAFAHADIEIKYPQRAALPSSPAAIGLDEAPTPVSFGADSETADLASSSAGASRELSSIEVVRERYASGKIMVEREVALDEQRNYVNHGAYQHYDERGNRIAAGEYRNGKMHGAWVRYFTNGRGQLFSGELEKSFVGPFLSHATFFDGKIHGTWSITSAKTQRKIIEWQFEEGVRHGKATWWYPNGEKRSEVHYKNGQPDGEYLEWGADKRLVRKLLYTDGRVLKTQVEWYSRGKKKYEGTHLMARKPAPTFDWWTGAVEVVASGDFGPDQKHGVWTAWYPNGQMQVQGRYEKGVPVGTFSWWHENGQKQAVGGYVVGLQDGTWITWHRNGMRESESSYRAGVLVGKLLTWESNGKLAEIKDFTSESEMDLAIEPPAETGPVETAAEVEPVEAALMPTIAPPRSEARSQLDSLELPKLR